MNSELGQRGFSTLEILIAMALLVTTLSAVCLVSFGNQSMLTQGGAHAEAVQKAQALLEEEQAMARKDFRLLHEIIPIADGIFQKSVSVEDWPSEPYATKRVTAHVSWNDESHTTREIELTTLIANFENPVGGDTCSPAVSGDWTHPQITNIDLMARIGTTSGAYVISDADAYHGRLYVTVNHTLYKSDPTIFIFDISDPSNIILLSAIDNDSASVFGPNGALSDGNYMYLANTSRPTQTGPLQIFNVSNPTSPVLVKNVLLAGNNAPGNAIFFKNGYVYLGLSGAGSNQEFNIIDVHDAGDPSWLGGYALGSGINAIYVRNGYAYLATDDSTREIMILDVMDASHPTPATGTVYHPSGLGVGESVFVVGDDLYFGRSFANNAKQLFLLDITNPALNMPLPIASMVVPGGVIGLSVRSQMLSFITSTTKQFQIFDISNLANFVPVAPALTLPGTGVSLDCEGNYFYVASNNGSQGTLSIITAGP